MAGSMFLAFWGVSIVFVCAPGPDWAFAISAGARGQRAVVPAVAGLVTGHWLVVVLVAAGVGALIAQHPEALTLLTGVGALYLLWLGVGSLRPGSTPHSTGPKCGVQRPQQHYFKGIGVTLLNPKVIILLLALLPQFTDPGAPLAPWAQLLTLGLAHVINCAIVYTAVGLGAARILSRRPGAARIVEIVAGLVMIALACAVLAEKAWEWLAH